MMKFEKVFDAWRVTLTQGSRELRVLTFVDPEKVALMAERGDAMRTLADRQAVEFALYHAPFLGICELRLSDEQLKSVMSRGVS